MGLYIIHWVELVRLYSVSRTNKFGLQYLCINVRKLKVYNAFGTCTPLVSLNTLSPKYTIESPSVITTEAMRL